MKRNDERKGAEMATVRYKLSDLTEERAEQAVSEPTGKRYGMVSLWFGVFAAALLNLLSVAFAFSLHVRQLLPLKWEFFAFLGILLVNVYVDTALIFVRRRRERPLRIFRFSAYVLALVLAIVMSAGMYYLHTIGSVLNAISSAKLEKVQLSILVEQADSAADEKAVQGQTVHAVMQRDGESAQTILTALGADSIQDVASYPALVGELYAKHARFILLNEAYRSIIEELHPKFSSETRVLKTYTVDLRTAPQGNDGKQPEQDSMRSYEPGELDGLSPFLIYVSGNDTYGPIGTVSRSDVNIVIAVNPQSHRMTMVTVPRDSYVPIAGGGNGYKDKLTHAGIYGIEASIGTLANLFDLPIEAYARVNFSSVIQLVDAMGGITVENPRYFTTADYEFDEGSIRLNGDEALAFARERYGLADGDFERGRNQLRVIEAMFNEIIKPDNLLRFQSIMDVVREGVDTNLSADAMSALVRNQLASGASWTIERISVDGYGASGLESYAMPGWNLSMVVLEDDSLEAARDALRAALS